MKIELFIVSICTMGLFACQPQNKKAVATGNDSISDTNIDTSKKTGQTDVQHPNEATLQTINLIKKSLTEKILVNDLKSIPADERKFSYQAFDLNNDNQEEYFVTIKGSYFCGSGGCNVYLLNHNGKLINYFTVVNFPIYIDEQPTTGFKNLIINSNGLRVVKFNNGKYPSNPSVQEKFNGHVSETTEKILDINNSQFPAFPF